MLEQIRVEQSFTLYATCKVYYEGRAKSTLDQGNYLIIHKSDGTLLIHGSTLIKPRNYQPPKSILKKQENKLISNSKKEQIIIEIDKIINYTEHQDWSNNKISLTGSESDLRDKLVEEINQFIPNLSEIQIEFLTPVGSIDILGIDDQKIYHIIEVKRAKSSLAACSQLNRYVNYFKSIDNHTIGYLASPEISKNALELIKNSKDRNWLKYDFN